MQVSAIVVPRVTCDLPTQPVYFNANWIHLNDLHLADPNFDQPNKIDILLGVDVYADVLLHGRQNGPPGTPVAFETKFGWVLTGKIDNLKLSSDVASLHVATLFGDDILRKFWEIEECPRSASDHSPEERAVVKHLWKTTRGMKMVDLLYHYPKTLRQNRLVNPDHLLYADSYIWSDHSTPRTNLMNLLQS